MADDGFPDDSKSDFIYILILTILLGSFRNIQQGSYGTSTMQPL